MTRDEQLAHDIAIAEARVKRLKNPDATASTKRDVWRSGGSAETAGLLVLDDGTLRALFTILTRVVDAPNPVAILDALLCADGQGLRVALETKTATGPEQEAEQNGTGIRGR